MSDQSLPTSVLPPTSSSLPVKLWTVQLISSTTFFLGFPAGIVLASINWMRMNLKNKALTYLISGAVGVFVISFLIIVLPRGWGTILGILANFGTLYFLQKEMKADIERFKADNNVVQNANSFGGCLIGLVILVLFVGVFYVIAFGIGFLSQIFGVTIPQ
jgi:hypothetical protein